MNWSIAALAIALALLVTACSGSSKTPTATPTPAYTATFEQSACPWPLPDGQKQEGVRCGFVVVPENRTKAASRNIRLAVAVFKATADTGVLEPVVRLQGGPGFSDVKYLGNNTVENMKPTQDRHDVVYFDQRGTGLSEPSLRCPEVRDNMISSFAEDLRAPED